jgi:uncharacterized RDD family membrane protein YckC
MTGQRIDSVFVVETPEGIQLPLRVAGLTSRVLANLIDQLIIGAIMYGLLVGGGLLALALGKAVFGFVLIALLVTYWFYPVVFEMAFRGQTIGKRALRLMVVQTNGAPVGWRNSVTRALLLAIDVCPLVSAPLMLWTRRFQRLGDIAADTMVIYLPRGRKLESLPDEPAGLAGQFTPEENRAALALAQRRGSLADARSREIVEPLAAVWGVPPEVAIQRLYGHARFIAGETR